MRVLVLMELLYVGSNDYEYGWRASHTNRNQPDFDGHESCAVDEDERSVSSMVLVLDVVFMY